ncbi:hypothetical protein WMY93_008358 [Mugilogobius chulae]|uniref:Uncharacterized protein n=1 Tax=Mugilogobius chulae TaxID=88201 RepID=A0AAW0PJ21_9GOBI
MERGECERERGYREGEREREKGKQKRRDVRKRSDKRRVSELIEERKKNASPPASADQRLVLCRMPEEWRSLPVHPARAAPTVTNIVSVYAPGPRRSVRYVGYIQPLLPAFVSPLDMDPTRNLDRARNQDQAMHPSTAWVSWRRRHQRLLARIQEQDRMFEERPRFVLPPTERG